MLYSARSVTGLSHLLCLVPFLDEITLDVLRGLQGIGAAACIPAVVSSLLLSTVPTRSHRAALQLGILAHNFPPSPIPSIAFATFAAGAPVGAAIGSAIGGVLTQLTKYVFGVLIDRQPYPPQPHPTPPHTPGYPPPPSLASSIHAPSPLSPGFSPSPPSAWNAAEDKTIHVWQESNDIPELVPLETPLTAVELGGNPSTFRATTQQTLGAGIVRASTPAPGWAESGPVSPLVKLPASTLRRSTPTLPCPPAYTPSPAPLSAPSPTSATSLVGSTTESSGWEDVDLDSDEQEERLRDDLGALPPRPASPSPMFFFYDAEEELEAGSVASSFAVGHGGLEAGMVSVSVQPVSC